MAKVQQLLFKGWEQFLQSEIKTALNEIKWKAMIKDGVEMTMHEDGIKWDKMKIYNARRKIMMPLHEINEKHEWQCIEVKLRRHYTR